MIHYDVLFYLLTLIIFSPSALVPFLVLKEDARGVGAGELISWCREKLAHYKVPQYIEFRDMLPKSRVGKLLRREIRDDERRRQEKGNRSKKEFC
ncbi:MAG: hypothetical protein AB1523_08315 [Bacillota bacterium]